MSDKTRLIAIVALVAFPLLPKVMPSVQAIIDKNLNLPTVEREVDGEKLLQLLAGDMADAIELNEKLTNSNQLLEAWDQANAFAFEGTPQSGKHVDIWQNVARRIGHEEGEPYVDLTSELKRLAAEEFAKYEQPKAEQ